MLLSFIVAYFPGIFFSVIALITGIVVYFVGSKKNIRMLENSYVSLKEGSKDWASEFENSRYRNKKQKPFKICKSTYPANP
jgi:hypothetical protein